jgi:hypothetical protein
MNWRNIMSKNLIVKITKRTADGVEAWEGTASLPGVRPSKIVKSKSDESKFSTRSALTSAAQRLATRYGFSDVRFEGAGSETNSTKSKKSQSTQNSQTSTLLV